MNFYVFDRLIDNTKFLKESSIDTIKLEDIINNFNKIAVCNGGINVSDAPLNFWSLSYIKDSILNVWRHINCPCILRTENAQVADANSCVYCRCSRKVVINFKNKIKSIDISRINLTKRRRINTQRKENRLKTKHKLMTIETIKTKINFMNETEISEKHKKLYVSSGQKMLLMECIHTNGQI